MNVRIDHAVTRGTFSLDGETHDVENNIWVVGNDDECVVIDAPHSVDDVLAVVGGRTVKVGGFVYDVDTGLLDQVV
jgi:hypothetical protein